MGVIFTIDGDEDDRHDESGESDTTGDEGTDEDESDDDSDDDAGGGEGDESDDSDKGDGKGKGSSQQKDKQDEDDDEDVPTRKPKTPADFVALRRGKALAKARDDAKKGKGQGGDGGGDDGDDDDANDTDPRSIAKKEVAKALAPFAERLEQEEVDTEIATFIQENPDFKAFAPKVAKWAQNEAWKGVPIERIFYAVAGKSLLKIGADRTREADKNAKKGRTGGGTGGDEGKRTNWSDAPLNEVGDEIERIKMQR